MKMIYPPEFVEKLKLGLPDHKRLHEALDKGETTSVRAYIDDAVALDPWFAGILKEWETLYQAFMRSQAFAAGAP